MASVAAWKSVPEIRVFFEPSANVDVTATDSDATVFETNDDWETPDDPTETASVAASLDANFEASTDPTDWDSEATFDEAALSDSECIASFEDAIDELADSTAVDFVAKEDEDLYDIDCPDSLTDCWDKLPDSAAVDFIWVASFEASIDSLATDNPVDPMNCFWAEDSNLAADDLNDSDSLANSEAEAACICAVSLAATILTGSSMTVE